VSAASQSFLPPTQGAPALERGSGTDGSAQPRRAAASSRDLPLAPPGQPDDPTSDAALTGASHGSGASATPVAIALGFLMFSALGLARWLRVKLDRLPRPPATGPPDRPG
jgi:hypothetical protein